MTMTPVMMMMAIDYSGDEGRRKKKRVQPEYLVRIGGRCEVHGGSQRFLHVNVAVCTNTYFVRVTKHDHWCNRSRASRCSRSRVQGKQARQAQ